MTISMSSFASTVGRLVVENQIASEEANDKLAHAAHLQAQEQINTKTALKEVGNELKSAMSYIEIGKSAVQTGKAAVGAVQAVNNVGPQMEQRQQISDTVGSARNGGSYPTGHDDGVASLRLGDATIGDRFNADQRAALFSGDPLPSDRALSDMGFTGREINELRQRAGSDGRLSMDQAMTFTQGHMPTAAQVQEHNRTGASFESMQDREKGKETAKEKALDQAVSLTNRGLGGAAKEKAEEAKKAGELTKFLNEIGSGLQDATLRHNRAVGEIELKSIKEQGSENTVRSNKH